MTENNDTIYDISHSNDVVRIYKGVTPTLSHRMGTGGNQVPLVVDDEKLIVRKLTPLECERIQGLPDNWTEGGSDTARYKAIGNGMAQPCPDFILNTLVSYIRKESNN